MNRLFNFNIHKKGKNNNNEKINILSKSGDAHIVFLTDTQFVIIIFKYSIFYLRVEKKTIPIQIVLKKITHLNVGDNFFPLNEYLFNNLSLKKPLSSLL